MPAKQLVEIDGEQWLRITDAATRLGMSAPNFKKVVVARGFEFTNILGQRTLYVRFRDFKIIVRDTIGEEK